MTDIIATVITICSTLLLGVLGFVVNSLVTRKSNSIQVITKTRLGRREKTKELISKIISSVDSYLYIEERNNDEELKTFIKAVNDLRVEYSNSFKCDRNLLQPIEKIKNLLMEHSKDLNDGMKKEIKELQKEFIKVADIYLQTEWKRIKLETVGKMKNKNLDSWDEIYSGYEKHYKEFDDKI